jgi:molybdopterin-containing oxidoreductase family iron-sulfur binding subunit
MEIAANRRSLRAPVWIQPGHPDNAVTLHLGGGTPPHGARRLGRGLRRERAAHLRSALGGAGATLTKIGETRLLATTQEHFSMEGRALVRVGTLEEYRREPLFAREQGESPRATSTSSPATPTRATRGG